MKFGRKQLWDELDMDNRLILVEGWARDGLYERQIMEKLGISHDTFYRWKRTRPEFYDALKKGKDISDRHVENALYKKALGYEVEETKVLVDGEKKRMEKVTKHIAPSEAAQIFWLKNRKPETWRDRHDYQHDHKEVQQTVQSFVNALKENTEQVWDDEENNG